MGAEQFPPALIKQFDKITGDQKNQENEQNDIEVDQQNENGIPRQIVRIAQLRQTRQRKGKQHDR